MADVSREDAEEFTQALGQIVAGGWRQIAWADRQGIPAALGMTLQDWVSERIGGYVRLSLPERREAVAELTEQGMSNRQAAAVLGVAESTVRADRAPAQNRAPDPDPEPEPQVTAEPEPEPAHNRAPLSWDGAVDRWSFLADVPAGDRKTALDGARQLAALDDRERPRREENLRRWCLSRLVPNDAAKTEARLFQAAEAAYARVMDLLAELPVAVTAAIERWDDVREPDAALVARYADDAATAAARIRDLGTSLTALRRIK